jgi:hypothetical protein
MDGYILGELNLVLLRDVGVRGRAGDRFIVAVHNRFDETVRLEAGLRFIETGRRVRERDTRLQLREEYVKGKQGSRGYVVFPDFVISHEKLIPLIRALQKARVHEIEYRHLKGILGM